MTDAQPNVHRRRLGLALRALRKRVTLPDREDGALTLADAAEMIGLAGQSALSKIESGKQRVPLSTLPSYFAAYGVDDPAVQEELRTLATLASSGKRSNLLNQFKGPLPDPFAEYLHLEELAHKSEVYTLIIPGLLQHTEYAEAIIRRSRQWESNREIRNYVNLRLERQRALHRDDPLQLWCIIDEAALHRKVGGPEVMKAQLQHLVDLSDEHPHVTIQVLPFEAGPHAGIDGAFTLLHFPAGPPVVVVEPMTTHLYLEDDSDLGRYETCISHLKAEALDPDSSRQFIIKLIKEKYL
ncbi:transcriptional regulator [Streptomyces sp. NRRL F-4489]|uniref:helix-turn-helix domain-containing protein n=1 Tax=Streptomyces sp. NRRL F-4489 TaxID=1609095 RepID=UPI000749E4FC|nr:helix-turn-helix transcriptional regulator [Streptomyces sp. NRRL F-4489]KUL44748.1 transcriptional regulator [Streptomyces sp. NRRL F-4489]